MHGNYSMHRVDFIYNSLCIEVRRFNSLELIMNSFMPKYQNER